MASVWGELKRRNVVRVAVAYGIVSWLILQVTDVLMPLLDLPEWVGRLVFLLLVIGLPPALIFAWAFELTPEGIKREKDVVRSESPTRFTSRKLDFFIIGALALALIYVIIDQYVLDESPPSAEVTENRRIIAVLPFANRSAAEENAAFFADGIHDELLTRLAKIGDLKVISRTSVMEYRDTTKNMRKIGEELGVGSILEGGVQRAGNILRINVQLIDAQTDEHLWADTYDRELSAANIFAIQSEISTSIATALRATLSPEEQERIAAVPTESIEVLEAYFIGQQLVDRRDGESLVHAMDYFEQAIELDPGFARAYSGLAEAWLQLPNTSATANPEQVRTHTAGAVQKATDLAPDSPDTLAVLGWYQLRHQYDWQGAARSFRRALQIEPTNSNALHWYSHLLSWQGNHAEAIEKAEQALAADPLSTLMQTHLTNTLVDARHWDQAFSYGEEILRRDTYLSLMRILWRAYLRAHRAEDAAAMLNNWAATTGRSVAAAKQLGIDFIHFQQTGQPVELPDDLLERLRIGQVDLAQVYASVGDREKTITALQSAHMRRIGSRDLLVMKINPSYDFVRDDPRFVELLDQIGLAD